MFNQKTHGTGQNKDEWSTVRTCQQEFCQHLCPSREYFNMLRRVMHCWGVSTVKTCQLLGRVNMMHRLFSTLLSLRRVIKVKTCQSWWASPTLSLWNNYTLFCRLNTAEWTIGWFIPHFSFLNLTIVWLSTKSNFLEMFSSFFNKCTCTLLSFWQFFFCIKTRVF